MGGKIERNWEEQGERIPCKINTLCEKKNLFTIKNKYIKSITRGKEK